MALLAIEGEGGQHGTKHLLLRDRMIERHVAKKRRRIVEAAIGRIGNDGAPGDDGYAIATRLIYHCAHPVELLAADQRAAIEFPSCQVLS